MTSTTGTDRNQSPRRPAFTLVELVIVVLIIGIMTAAAVPEFGDSLQFNRVESAASRIAADLQMARNRARMASADQVVDFDAAAASYTMPGLPDLDHPGQDYTVNLAGSPYNVLLTYVDFNGVDLVTFNGSGIPDSAGEIDVESGGYLKTVVLDASGRVTSQ